MKANRVRSTSCFDVSSVCLVKEVSLHGRKMIGRDLDLPRGYRGVVMGKLNQQMGYLNIDGSGAEKVDFEALGEFTKVTEWKKDAWDPKIRGFASNVFDYLECAKILHCELIE